MTNAKASLTTAFSLFNDCNDYGGNQRLLKTKTQRNCGCGIIAAANIICHLLQKKLSRKEYCDFCERLNKKYIPLLPYFGIDGITLAFGLSRALSRFGLRAAWCFSQKKLLSRVCDMLERDIPVVLSIGPSLPFVGKNKGVFLYGQDTHTTAVKTKAHFVTVTACDGEFFEVSSWGKKFYINIPEYFEYSKKYSLSAFCNIACIYQKRQNSTIVLQKP